MPSPALPDLSVLLERLLPVLDEAASATLAYYGGTVDTRYKADRSPVTAADEAAEGIILKALAQITPDIPVVAEERAAAGLLPEVGEGPFWLVDPLDGTKEFLSRNGEFTVNIGLIERSRPVLGLVSAPALGAAWLAAAGRGAFRRQDGTLSQISVRPADRAHLVAVASRSHRDEATERWLAAHGIRETIAAGSSLKFCTIAEGRADVYPRFGPTMEWDTAAGQAVLEIAGGRVVTTGGAPLLYGKQDFRNPGFIAYGGLVPFESPTQGRGDGGGRR